jgi:hypothetical protein
LAFAAGFARAANCCDPLDGRDFAFGTRDSLDGQGFASSTTEDDDDF